ncbi:hypothetical protein BH09SUM1_BH09SUM1_32970 [soil metagenome]
MTGDNRRAPLWPHIAVAAAIFAYWWFLFRSMQGFTDFMDYGGKLFGDFFYVFKDVGNTVFTTKEPPWGYFYSSFFAVFLGVLCKLPGDSEYYVWGLLEALVTLTLWLVPLWFIRRSRNPRFAALRECSVLYTALYLLSIPILHCFRWGQMGVLLLILMLAASVLREKGKPNAAGAVLALAISIKFYPAVLLLWFALRRDLRAIAVAIGVAGFLLVIVPSLTLGVRTNIAYVRHTQEAAYHMRPKVEADMNSQYFPSVIRRMVGKQPGEFRTPKHLLMLAGLILYVMNALILWRLKDYAGIAPAVLAVLFLQAGFSFALLTSWPHYFVHLPLLQFILIAMAWRNTAMRWRGVILGLAIASALASTLPFRHALMLFTHEATTEDYVYPYSYSGILFWANLLCLIAAWVAFNREADLQIGGSTKTAT